MNEKREEFTLLMGMVFLSTLAAGYLLTDRFKGTIGASQEAKEVALAPEEYDVVEDKVQYQPETEAQPLLQKKVLPSEWKTGVKYESGEDVTIDPSPEFKVKNEAIREKEQ